MCKIFNSYKYGLWHPSSRKLGFYSEWPHISQIIIFRTLGGRIVNTQDFEALPEFATICAMCNDSSVDYNAVRTDVDLLLFIFLLEQWEKFFFNFIIN